MNKTLITLLILTTVFVSCKDKKDLVPAGISDNNRVTVIQKKGKYGHKYTQDVCEEIWFDGSDAAVSKYVKLYRDLLAVMLTPVPSCNEFKKSAVGACIADSDSEALKEYSDGDRMLRDGIVAMHTITYVLVESDGRKCTVECRRDKCEYKAF